MPNKFSWGKFVLALAFVGGLFILVLERKPHMIKLRGQTMGTTYTVKYLRENNPPPREEIHKDIKAILQEVNLEMSTYMKSSIISEFNSLEGRQWMKIPEGMSKVVDFSLNLAKKSEGAFDPTLGPLVNLWGFGPNGKREVPSEKELQETLEFVGYKNVLEFQRDKNQLRKLHPKAYLDLSATAKGFGVDRVSEFLFSQGLPNHLVEIGGEVRARGKKLRSAWKVGIETPSAKLKRRVSEKIVELNDQSLATSGSYRNFFREGGKIYQHTIDAKTGKPVKNRVLSVSVVHNDSCMEADGWATALMAMGLDKGLTVAERENLAVYFIALPKKKSSLEKSEEGSSSSGQKQGSFVEVSTSAFKAQFEVDL